MSRRSRSAALFGVFVCCAITAYAADKIITDDKNNDGKPDVFVTWRDGLRTKGEEDKDFDGKVDTWFLYDAAGKPTKTARDTNGDGKPDEYKDLLKGRMLVLKSADRNFDGKIDKRKLDEWKQDKTISTYLNNRIQKLPNPGYVTLWSEEDNDYDGKVDVYKEKGNKNPSRDRIGQYIESEVKI